MAKSRLLSPACALAAGLAAAAAVMALAAGGRALAAGVLAGALGATAVAAIGQALAQGRARRLEARRSRTDALTGLLDRRGFDERLRAEVAVGARHGRPLSLVLLVLEARAGQAGVTRAGQLLHRSSRPEDAVAHLGAGIFALLLPGAVKHDARRVAERARESLAGKAPARTGVAAFPEDGLDAGALHEAASADLGGRGAPGAPPTDPDVAVSWAAAFARSVDRATTLDHEHSWAVAGHAAAIAVRLRWPEEEVEALRLAALLHDVGKVVVPERVLSKPGPLTPQEFVDMAQHPPAGARMLERIAGLERVATWVLHSHERYDGGGYPDGLAGAHIPLASRIIFVADAFDAMTSARPYRRAMSVDEALAELHRHAGTQFDPVCVEAFEAHVTALRYGGPGEPPA